MNQSKRARITVFWLSLACSSACSSDSISLAKQGAGEGGGSGMSDGGSGAGAGEGGAGEGGGASGGSGGQAGQAGGGSGGSDDDDCAEDNGIRTSSLEVGDDLEELRCVVEVRGNLMIRLGERAPAMLPRLREVTGDFTLASEQEPEEQPRRFELPRLQTTGSLTITGLRRVETLALPELETVHGSLRVEGNAALRAIDDQVFPALRRIDQDLILGKCAAVGSSWEQVFSCEKNAALEQVHLPALQTVRSVLVGSNPKLQRFDAPKLKEAKRLQVPQCVPIWNAEQDKYGEEECAKVSNFTDLLLPSLASAERMQLRGPGAMERVGLGSLRDIQTLEVSGVGSDDQPLPLELPSLTEAETLTVHDAKVTLEVPVLSNISSIVLSDVAFSEAPVFPELVAISEFKLTGTNLTAFDCSETFPSLPHDAYPALFLSGEVLSDFACAEVVAAVRMDFLRTSFRAVSLPLLVTTEWLSFRENEELGMVQAPSLEEATIELEWAPKLSSVDLPKLRLAQAVRAVHTKLETLALPALANVNGWLTLESNAALTELTLPNLTTAGQLYIEDNAKLTDVELPELRHLLLPKGGAFDQTISIRQNAELLRLHMPLSDEIWGVIEISKNPKLAAVELDELGVIFGYLVISGNPALSEVSVPLREARGVTLSNGTFTAAPGCELSEGVVVSDDDEFVVTTPHSLTVRGVQQAAWVTVGSTVALQSVTFEDLTTSGRVDIRSNHNLGQVSMPGLGPDVEELSFSDNPKMLRPSMPLLTSAARLSASGNTAWPECDIDAWASELQATCECDGNGACSP